MAPAQVAHLFFLIGHNWPLEYRAVTSTDQLVATVFCSSKMPGKRSFRDEKNKAVPESKVSARVAQFSPWSHVPTNSKSISLELWTSP